MGLISDAGFLGDLVSIYVLFAPSKTPSAVVVRLNREVVKLVKQGEIRERFFRSGMDTLDSTPEESPHSYRRTCSG